MAKSRETMRFGVEGLQPPESISKVEKALARVEGVRKVEVRPGAGEVQIWWDSSDGTGPGDFENALREAGFTPHAISPEAEEIGKAEKRGNRKLILRFTFAILCTIPILILEAGLVTLPYQKWILVLLSLLVLFGAGASIFLGAIRILYFRTTNLDSLIALGTGTAFAYSVFALATPRFWTNIGHEPHTYFGTAAGTIVLILIGRYLEKRAEGRTSERMRKLVSLQPRTAHLVEEDGETVVPVGRIKRKQILRVLPGERIPADGQIVEGNPSIDESALTGEAMPVTKGPGDLVMAATLNKTGTFTFAVERTGNETTLQQVLELEREAKSEKSPIGGRADLVCSYYVPAIVLVAITTFLAWFIFAPADPATVALFFAAAVLIAATPAALALAAPAAILAGKRKATKRGVAVRTAESLETAGRITHVLLDKTGILTEGKPQVTDLQVLGRFSQKELLRFAASVERPAEHPDPVSEAILARAEKDKINLSEAEHFQAFSGLGVTAVVQKRAILLGSREFMDEMGIWCEPAAAEIESLENAGKTVVLVGEGEDLAGIIAIADPVRESASRAIERMRKLGLEVLMVTGDNARSARAIADQVGIDDVFANVRPDEKVEKVRELQEEGNRVAMVGDGINDAPAVAAADVGFVIGNAADAAQEAGAVLLSENNLNGIADFIRISRRTLRGVKQNLVLVFLAHLFLIPLAAGCLYPDFGWTLTPLYLVGAMVLGLGFVILNTLRLRWFA